MKDEAVTADVELARSDPRWYPDGLYIHLPFCAALCTYCDFAREEYSKERTKRYLKALERELASKVKNLRTQFPSQSKAEGRSAASASCSSTRVEKSEQDPFAPRTIFLGGGTPSALDPNELETFFAALKRHVDLSRIEEFTIEANPGSTDSEKLDVLLKQGVNRISFGVQSFRPHLLKLLGRIHGADQGREAVSLARKAGFENISIDLMHGLPGQSLEDLEQDLKQALALDLDHLSAYGLIYEKGTPLTGAVEAGKVGRLSSEEESEHYRLVMDRLESGGLAQYEISNYSKAGREAFHNLIYWHAEAYLAAGVSAAQYVAGRRATNVRDMNGYMQAVEAGRPPVDMEECLDWEPRVREAFMLALRLRKGVDLDVFREKWELDPKLSKDLETAFITQLKSFESNGLMERTSSGAWRIARKALPVSDGILREFL